MSFTRHNFRFLCVGVGFLLVCSSVALGYWWLYKLGPVRHLENPGWVEAHSAAARWKEEQKDYYRNGSSPDLIFRGDRIGYYGNKKWFLWLSDQVRNPKNFRVCGCSDFALALMANHYASSWGQWTDANRERSQEEWIRDGFKDYGVTVHLPPESDDPVPLLKLLGRTSWNFLMAGPQGNQQPEAVPSYVQYNAFRWLRDSGFDAEKFAHSGAAQAAGPEVSAALLKYCRLLGVYPARDGLGVLAFGNHPYTGSDFRGSPLFLKWWVQGAVYAVMFLFLGAGIALLVGTKKKSG